MTTAPGTSTSSKSSLPSSSSPPGQRGGGAKPSTAGAAAGDAAGLGGQGFEPFVQLASWGHGSFTPLAQFTSGGLLLGGGRGDGSEHGEGGWGVPSGAGAAAGTGAACQVDSGQEESCGKRDHALHILTREGNLEIASAGGEYHKLLQWQLQRQRVAAAAEFALLHVQTD